MVHVSSKRMVRAGVIGYAMVALVVSSCGGDDDADGASGGTGASGQGGGGGSGGSKGGNGGASGKGGGAGSTATGGSGATGGAAGQAGDGGDAGDESGGAGAGRGGSAGENGGSGGVGGGTAGAAGSGAGEGGEGGEGGESDGNSLEVTPEDGGTLTVGTTTLVVPPGAVATTTTVTIQEIAPSSVAGVPGDFQRVGPVVALLPHGLTFSQPVEVTLGHTSSAALLDPAILRLDDEVDTSWENVASPSFDADSVTFSTSTFSVVTPAVPGSPGCSPRIVISAIYTAGGQDQFQGNNDFVELHNRGPTPFSTNGLALQLNDGTSPSAWTVVPLNGTVAPGGFYLVGLGRDDVATGILLPPRDATSTYNLAVPGGRVAITQGTTPLTGAGPWSVVSGVAYGTSSSPVEGTPIAAPMNLAGGMIARFTSSCAYSGNNATDLFLANRRQPFNTESTPVACSCGQ